MPDTIGGGAVTAGIDDLLVPHLNFDHVLRQFAASIPKVNLESERVERRLFGGILERWELSSVLAAE